MQATTGNTLRLLVMCKSVQQFLISMQGVGSCICFLAKNLGSEYILYSEINMCATTLGCNRKQFTARLQRIWRFTYMQKDRPFTTESRWCKLCVQQLRVKRGPVVEVYILLIRKLEDFQSQCTTPPHWGFVPRYTWAPVATLYRAIAEDVVRNGGLCLRK